MWYYEVIHCILLNVMTYIKEVSCRRFIAVTIDRISYRKPDLTLEMYINDETEKMCIMWKIDIEIEISTMKTFKP